ncbi:hypothetical protein SFC81_17895, partial [Enterococcus faecalis]
FILDKKPTYFEKRKIKNKSVGQKSLWIFAPRSKTDKRREQKQHYALLRSQQLLRCFLDMRLVTVQPSKELQL